MILLDKGPAPVGCLAGSLLLVVLLALVMLVVLLVLLVLLLFKGWPVDGICIVLLVLLEWLVLLCAHGLAVL